MNKEILQQRSAQVAAEFEKKTYQELLGIAEESMYLTEGDKNTGNFVQIKISAFIEDEETGDLQVSIAADDGGWRAFIPVVVSFIKKKAMT